MTVRKPTWYCSGNCDTSNRLNPGGFGACDASREDRFLAGQFDNVFKLRT